MATKEIVFCNLDFTSLLFEKQKKFVLPENLKLSVDEKIKIIQKNPKDGIAFIDDLECVIISLTTTNYTRKRGLIYANLKIIRQIQKK
jgi:hypothetical protein